jgi:hypothetical protein
VHCSRAGALFPLVVAESPAMSRAIATISQNQWVPVRYPCAVIDPDIGQLILGRAGRRGHLHPFERSPAPVTARLIVRRVRDRNEYDELFPMWRYHPFFTNNTKSTTQADITHRRHAIIETNFADLIDGPLAHLPSGRFRANSAWAICAG